jgi:phosphopantothenoylcysteine synthetase/decarboxylase
VALRDRYNLSMRFLVTAGNTREPIDRVRDWGNIFTGNTGRAIALALAEVGHVDLLTSNRAHIAELAGRERIATVPFTTHTELKVALAQCMNRTRYDAVFMSAAVADYRPAGAYRLLRREAGERPGVERWTVEDVQAGKVSGAFDEIAIRGQRTEKLVDLFRTQWNHRGLLVKFKLEVGCSAEELIRVGQASRLASGADYLVANTLDMINGPGAGAYLLWQDGQEWVARDELPARMVRLVVHNTRAGRT